MHIMFYYGTLQQGGSERVISSLANNFAKRGEKVSILVLDENEPLYSLDKEVNYINLCANQNSKNVFDALKNNYYRLIMTRKVFFYSHPNVVICFGINNLFHTLLVKNGLGIKTIGSERSNPYYSSEKNFWKKMKIFLSPFADGYIFSSAGARDYYPAITQKKSIIIPNGVFVQTIPDPIPALAQRRQKTICAVGRLEPVKGFDILIEAFSLFHEKFPDFTLHIYGEGKQKNELAKKIGEKGLKNSIFLEGYITDVPAVLCSHTMFVFTSLHEGMPNALIEALACGLPCVAVNCDFGPSDLIRDGENGLLVPVNDIEAISEAMIRIAANDAFAKKLSQNALQIHTTHSMEKISQRFYDYIYHVMKET